MATPFIYCYAVGGLVFLAGLLYAWRGGQLGAKNLIVCLGVLLFFGSLQAWLQFAPMEEAPAAGFRGGPTSIDVRRRGEPIDYAIVVGYFVMILAVGTWFARRQKTTKDFFFGGQRFSWWLVSFSLIATTVGSYSFVKYSSKGFEYGLSSSQTYLNDWIWFPLLVFGWLPIIYFSRVTSIPEYFARRFNNRVRAGATICILIYLIGYVGVNLFTMGKVLNALLGWDIRIAALLVAAVSCTYVTAGGQTSVIMTDLLQGVMLLLTGGLILLLGVQQMGGVEPFWTHLPRSARLAFPNFNQDPSFPSVGVFWQDGIANTAMFYFLNQGIMMRFLACKSLAESRKAALAMVLVLMTVGACVVGGGGWVARVLVHSGRLPADLPPDQAFYVATDFISRPGVFGLILAALTAALMSTVDTLITAVSAIAVNDVYKAHLNPRADDASLLRVARFCSVAVTVMGVLLVPLFMTFDTIYDAHAAFTAAVTPPLVVTLLLSVFWRRFTQAAALWTIGGGLAAVLLSMVFPQVIVPFAHGVPMTEAGDGLLSGMKQFKFMRACYGIGVCSAIGVLVTLLTRPEPLERQRGLVWGPVSDALRHFKGGPGEERPVRVGAARLRRAAADRVSDHAELPLAEVSRTLAEELELAEGDLLYVSDARWYLGGLRSSHALVDAIVPDEPSGESLLSLGPTAHDAIAAANRADAPVRVERLY